MFDIGAPELLIIVIVAVLVIGPKDLPLALRTAGRWIGKLRRVSGHFRTGLDAMIREAEMEDMEKKWKEQNEKIMRENPAGTEMEPTGALPSSPPVAPPVAPPAASAEAAVKAPAPDLPAAASPAPGTQPENKG